MEKCGEGRSREEKKEENKLRNIVISNAIDRF